MQTISQKIRTNVLPQGYQIKLEDLWTTIDGYFGRVQPSDVGRKVWLSREGQISMESMEQAAERKAKVGKA